MVYCKRIPINGSSAKDGTNYVMTLTIPYVADKMRADFADIRFTNDLGINYTYTLVSKTDSSTATFDIKIPSIPQSTTSYLKALSLIHI